ncbi:MAG: glycosyl hydrolase 115 family protein [Prevotella sp.]|nr:glycosyl hydrolase 115 family protein [Prevotella sp.]
MSLFAVLPLSVAVWAGSFSLRQAALCYDARESQQVIRAVGDLQQDVRRVSGALPPIVAGKARGPQVVIGTYGRSRQIADLISKGHLREVDLQGRWESYVVAVTREKTPRLVIAGSTPRGTIYGIYDVSERLGVSPWYWWADVPVRTNPEATVDVGYYASGEPTVRYRGIFINDEDWGLLPWAAQNYERQLGDIGPRTYARVCELLLRLKANMLAPAMHSCTGAFYSHPESAAVCDSFGIIVTTSHCEPLLLNNAAQSEWDQQRDGDWNYKTNSAAIRQKWDARLAMASRYENIYTVAMRGLHDAGLRGNLPMAERVPLLEQVIADQRQLLVRHRAHQPHAASLPSASSRTAAAAAPPATIAPQIFVPYKETMDIYENGLRVPDDITLVWVDDNYGYMKRVSTPEEQQRQGGAGVYYHLSYLGAPHDYLWLNTTPPVLMYEELKKAYDTGANRYWLLNVGDIKPMELGMQTFMDMAWNFGHFDYDRARTHQAELLARLLGGAATGLSVATCQRLLDEHYRLAWIRKPEYMGFEYEWDDKEHTGLHATDFSFANYDDAQQRLADYEHLSDAVEQIALGALSADAGWRAAFYELLQFPIQAACQMNRKFLLAQAGYAAETEAAYDSIDALNRRYNELLGGKWRGMMTVPPGYCALYHQKPAVAATAAAVDLSLKNEPLQGCCVLDLSRYDSKTDGARLIGGLGYDWQVVQLGSPTQPAAQNAQPDAITYTFPAVSRDTVEVTLYTLPFWPLYAGRSNAIAVSVDGGPRQVFENRFKEYDRSWKDQVMRNGAVCRMLFAVDASRPSHTIRFAAVDPGQMVQRVVIDWGGLKPTYVGPSPRFANK